MLRLLFVTNILTFLEITVPVSRHRYHSSDLHFIFMHIANFHACIVSWCSALTSFSLYIFISCEIYIYSNISSLFATPFAKSKLILMPVQSASLSLTYSLSLRFHHNEKCIEFFCGVVAIVLIVQIIEFLMKDTQRTYIPFAVISDNIINNGWYVQSIDIIWKLMWFWLISFCGYHWRRPCLDCMQLLANRSFAYIVVMTMYEKGLLTYWRM